MGFFLHPVLCDQFYSSPTSVFFFGGICLKLSNCGGVVLRKKKWYASTVALYYEQDIIVSKD